MITKNAKFWASDSWHHGGTVILSKMKMDTDFEHKDEKECIKDMFGVFSLTKGSRPVKKR